MLVPTHGLPSLLSNHENPKLRNAHQISVSNTTLILSYRSHSGSRCRHKEINNQGRRSGENIDNPDHSPRLMFLCWPACLSFLGAEPCVYIPISPASSRVLHEHTRTRTHNVLNECLLNEWRKGGTRIKDVFSQHFHSFSIFIFTRSTKCPDESEYNHKPHLNNLVISR